MLSRFWIGLGLLGCSVAQLNADTQTLGADDATFRNPVLPGFYPDPSVCRVGDEFYLVNSSFAWFPGVPIHRSKDLVNWEQIGHVLARPSQLDLGNNVGLSSGIWAPTLRFHRGKFYLITTLQPGQRNFYVTAENPAGPWSEPVFLPQAKGIDPELFFDDDGKVWYVGNINPKKEDQRWLTEHRIWLQEIDLVKNELVGERHELTSGDFPGYSPYAEGPHIYKIDGKYVLLIAEGGTWEKHAVTVFRSDKITGPYVRNPHNPILTHRHLGDTADITTTGHADLVQTAAGDWWAVCLGVRPFGVDRHYTLGRETFLLPARIEAGWPVLAPNIGRVRLRENRPALPWTPVPPVPARDEFDAPQLGLTWNFLRTPRSEWWSLASRPGWLAVQLRAPKLTEQAQPSLVARRLQHHTFHVSTRLDFDPQKENEVAGLVLLQNESSHYRFELAQVAGRRHVRLTKVTKDRAPQSVLVEETLASLPTPVGPLCLVARGRGDELMFSFGPTPDALQPVGGVQSIAPLSTKAAGGFVGAYLGMYASAQGQPSEALAHFDWFEYRDE